MPSARLLAPRYWPAHLFALVLVAIAATLGGWQLDAWQVRRAAEARDLTKVDPVPLASVLGPDDTFPGDKVGQPVIVAGHWLPEETFQVTNRESRGRDGQWVVTPLAVGDPDGPALLVVRGWIPLTGSKAPDGPVDSLAPPPAGVAEFVAWLQPSESSRVADDDPTDDVLPELRVADVLQRLDRDLYSGYAVVADEVAPGDWPHGEAATNDGTDGLVPADLDALPPAGRFTALRNLLYALEWWLFGLFAAFIWWRWCVDEMQVGESAAPGDG